LKVENALANAKHSSNTNEKRTH